MNSSDAAPKGHLHPLTQIIRQFYAAFYEIGFEIADGPELEDEFHNFDALNIPKDHPARDMQDTFWVKPLDGDSPNRAGHKKPEDGKRPVLRTHTSPVQIRFMETHEPPIRIIVPGKVYRNEATDATHEAQFHQVEGMYIDKNVTVAHLKGVFEAVLRKIFGPEVEIQFRPSFFAFTEPSLEVWMKLKNRWIEVGGSGLAHPNVLRAAGLDPKKWQGFAFGFGVDRLAILKFGHDDVRHAYTGDLRFINQF